MKKILCIFLLFSSLLSAKSSMTPYLTSESDTLALVDGVINAYNGKLVQIDPDIEIQGSDPLQLIRYYDGGQQRFDSEFGYGIGMSLPTQLSFDTYEWKRNMLIEQRMGLELLFSVKEQKSKKKHKEKTYVGTVDPKCFELGYTNCCEALLRGESSLCAMKVAGTKNNFVVTLGDGTKRHYDYFLTEYEIFCYRLVLEEKANGNRRHFSYAGDHSIWLSKVCTKNHDDSITLNWINITYEPDYQVIATASNGQSVRYQKTLKKGKAKQKIGWQSYVETTYRKWLLTQVSGAHLPTTNFEHLNRTLYRDTVFSVQKVTKPDGHSLAVEFDSGERVKKVFSSGVEVPLYTFDYHSHHTTVQNALGAVQQFDFSKRRLTKLSEGYRTQNFSWDSKGQLTSHVTTDPNGNVINKREYHYDDLGNVVESQIHGQITSSTSQDCFVLRHTYSKNGRNLMLTENHNCEKEFSFEYLPNTNLMTRKLTFADQHFAEREFRG
ncbi:MAG: hypothetical protein K940chlam7_01137 [Chlamydiae bacterium]|nr:hypothetical protein [Chlamydiota bacterium]